MILAWASPFKDPHVVHRPNLHKGILNDVLKIRVIGRLDRLSQMQE